MLLETACGTKYISPEAFDALTRLGRDIFIVAEAMPRSRVRQILSSAARAFVVDSSDREAAWTSLVLAVDSLLRHVCEQTRSHHEAAWRRLQTLVDDNADLLEKLSEATAS